MAYRGSAFHARAAGLPWFAIPECWPRAMALQSTTQLMAEIVVLPRRMLAAVRRVAGCGSTCYQIVPSLHEKGPRMATMTADAR